MIRLLGEVTAHVGDRTVDLGPARQRCVLAALAVDAGQVVATDRLIDRVWAPGAPNRAQATLHSYVSRLRQVMAGSYDIVRRSGGYVLLAGTEAPAVDLARFRELSDLARGAGDEHAERLLGEALALWRGDALTGLDSEWVREERARLHRERLAAEHDLVDTGLRLGQGEELVVALSTRVTEHPLDERVAGQYLLALYRAGRASDALTHYQEMRRRLVDELGTDPGPALQELHARILAADPALDATPVSPPAEPTTRPRELPAAPAPFVGRDDELDLLDDIIPGDLSGGTRLALTAITGAGGIGKSWLALHWAHRHLHRFPDGQLFVDLRGFSPDGPPMAPTVALRGFLTTLGVAPVRIPVDEHAQTAMFRSLVADRRMLVLLDNAADTSQVTPLLPGGGTCAVVVTSRNRLAGLATRHGARYLLLDVLTDLDAHALLRERLGTARVDAEPAAIGEVIALCGGFPLALSIIAGHALTRPRQRLTELAAELRDLGLDALADEDPTASLPAVLSWSRHALPPEQAELFALLGIAPGPDISLPAAAHLAGRSESDTRSLLRGLTLASLLTQGTGGRYRMHELIRQHAVDTAHEHVSAGGRTAALGRVLGFYLHAAYPADRLLAPEREPITLVPHEPAGPLPVLPDDPTALAWFADEHACLLAAQQTAAAVDWPEAVWQLAWVLNTFHYRRGLFHDELAAWQAALAQVDQLADPSDRLLVHRLLGRVHGRLRRYDDAVAHLHQARALAEQTGDPMDAAYVHGSLCQLYEQQGDLRRSLKHGGRALELFRVAGDPLREAQSLANLGWLAARLGDHDAARRHCTTALAIHQDHGFRDGVAHTLDSLGYIEHLDGNHVRAIDYYQQALVLWRELGDRFEEAGALEPLGDAHVALGQLDRALDVWCEALALFRAQHRTEDANRVRRRLDELRTGQAEGTGRLG